MTCIVGVVEKDAVWLGGDSAFSSGVVRRYAKNKKLFRSGPLLIGPAGVSRPFQLMEFLWTAPEHDVALDALEYLAVVAMPSLEAFFREKQVLNQEDDGGSINGTMLIACAGRLFRSDGYFNISECDGPYAAIGSGEEPALGALYLAHEQLLSLGAQNIISAALRASAHFHSTVAPPFHIEKL